MSRTRTLFVPAALLVAGLLSGCTSKTGDTEQRANPTSVPPSTDAQGAPVFPVPTDTEAFIKRAGLTVLATEGTGYHIHAHLDVRINDKAVTVPANIGVEKSGGISPLHTHDKSGVVHIEAPEKATFRVGQLFQEWDVKLDKGCIATFCSDERHQLIAYVNGELAADPSAVPFSEGAEIAIWYGPKETNPSVPTSYDFEG